MWDLIIALGFDQSDSFVNLKHNLNVMLGIFKIGHSADGRGEFDCLHTNNKTFHVQKIGVYDAPVTIPEDILVTSTPFDNSVRNSKLC